MILDRLTNAGRYMAVHPRFGKAFDFLRRTNLAALEPGRHEICGDDVYVVVIRRDGKGRQGTKLEVHKKYVDIQFAVAGRDAIGWKDAADCSGGGGYDAEKDTELFICEPDLWVDTPPGAYAIFFPEDAHAPMGATGPLHKVVVKVRV
jgi:YhcH/YjgK/YiaL family protein